MVSVEVMHEVKRECVQLYRNEREWNKKRSAGDQPVPRTTRAEMGLRAPHSLFGSVSPAVRASQRSRSLWSALRFFLKRGLFAERSISGLGAHQKGCTRSPGLTWPSQSCRSVQVELVECKKSASRPPAVEYRAREKRTPTRSGSPSAPSRTFRTRLDPLSKMDDWNAAPSQPPSYALESSSGESDWGDEEELPRRPPKSKELAPEAVVSVEGSPSKGQDAIFLVGEAGENVAKGIRVDDASPGAKVSVDGQQVSVELQPDSET